MHWLLTTWLPQTCHFDGKLRLVFPVTLNQVNKSETDSRHNYLDESNRQQDFDFNSIISTNNNRFNSKPVTDQPIIRQTGTS